MQQAGALLYSFLIIGALIVLVLWILLPFAVFGMKPLLRQAVHEQAETRRVLERLLSAVERGQPAERGQSAQLTSVKASEPHKPNWEGYKPNWPD
jgi:Na+-transporting methylmalonyl-CoA/oxaloacetate decarboxylase gamma subunit